MSKFFADNKDARDRLKKARDLVDGILKGDESDSFDEKESLDAAIEHLEKVRDDHNDSLGGQTKGDE